MRTAEKLGAADRLRLRLADLGLPVTAVVALDMVEDTLDAAQAVRRLLCEHHPHPIAGCVGCATALHRWDTEEVPA